MQRPLVILLIALVNPVAIAAQADSARAPDPIAQLVGRLELERYKATIKGLTAFGDRRQGTDRNRAAVDWIEAQLRSYGCSDVSRLKYDYQPPAPRTGNPQPRDTSRASGGGRYRGIRARTGVNSDSLKQPDARIRTLDAQASTAGARDHGMPRADGTLAATQRPEADVNIEFQVSSKFAVQAQQLAWVFQVANEKYATDYPASVGSHMTNTDSAPFQDHVPAISLRENERGTQIGAGWGPDLHQCNDLYATYDDADFRLGLNAAPTTLAALPGLTRATLK